MIYDITDTKRTEQKLQELTQTLEERVQERTRERDQVWNCSLDLIAVTTRDGSLRSVNPAWTAVLGHEENSLLDHSFTEFVHSEDRSAAMKALGAEAAVEHLDLRLRDAEGGWRSLEWTLVPEGEAIYATGRDVTERRRIEEQLRQSAKDGGGGSADRRHRARLQQHADGHHRRSGAGAAPVRSRTRGRGVRIMDAVVASAERAAALTHRLLAFSRRQTLNPSPWM